MKDAASEQNAAGQQLIHGPQRARRSFLVARARFGPFPSPRHATMALPRTKAAPSPPDEHDARRNESLSRSPAGQGSSFPTHPIVSLFARQRHPHPSSLDSQPAQQAPAVSPLASKTVRSRPRRPSASGPSGFSLSFTRKPTQPPLPARIRTSVRTESGWMMSPPTARALPARRHHAGRRPASLTTTMRGTDRRLWS